MWVRIKYHQFFEDSKAKLKCRSRGDKWTCRLGLILELKSTAAATTPASSSSVPTFGQLLPSDGNQKQNRNWPTTRKSRPVRGRSGDRQCCSYAVVAADFSGPPCCPGIHLRGPDPCSRSCWFLVGAKEKIQFDRLELRSSK